MVPAFQKALPSDIALQTQEQVTIPGAMTVKLIVTATRRVMMKKTHMTPSARSRMPQRELCVSGPASKGTSKQFHHSVELGKRRKLKVWKMKCLSDPGMGAKTREKDLDRCDMASSEECCGAGLRIIRHCFCWHQNSLDGVRISTVRAC